MAKKINKSMAVTGRVLNVDSKEERAGDINKIRRYNEEQKKLWEADKEGRTHIVYIRTHKLNNIIPFIVRRNKFEGSKTWFYCGYVGVPKTHHAFGQSINGWSDGFFDLRCHGGLTYSDNIYDVTSATFNSVVYPSVDPAIFEIKYPDSDIRGRVMGDL